MLHEKLEENDDIWCRGKCANLRAVCAEFYKILNDIQKFCL
jgi:hypothetical protein